jgi:integrase
MFALLYGCGLRRSEVAAADLDDLTIEDGQECGSLLVHGKGNRERTVYPANNGTIHCLKDWLKHRGNESGALFCPVNKGGRVTVRRMTDQAVYYAMRKRGQEGRLENFTPHDLRRSCASELLDAGVDISVVQRIMGHAQVTTTARYDRRGEDSKRRASGMLHVPWRGTKTSAA